MNLIINQIITKMSLNLNSIFYLHIQTWGDNYNGVLGNGSFVGSNVPIQIDNCVLSVGGFEKEKQFNLYPNPTNGQVNVSFNVKYNPTIAIYDLLGRLVKEYIFNEHIGIQVVDLNQMSQGVYIVLLKENGIIAEQQKLIVK